MKQYEIANHLGNVRVTFSDVKNYDPVALSYSSSLSSVNNYYSFGSLEPSRTWSSESYRFGFNGKENDNEVKGTGNSVDFGARIYDPRIGRWMSTDPLQQKYPDLSPYNFCANNPIMFIDPDGKKIIIPPVSRAAVKSYLLEEFGNEKLFRIRDNGLLEINKRQYKKYLKSDSYSENQKDMLRGMEEAISAENKECEVVVTDEDVINFYKYKDIPLMENGVEVVDQFGKPQTTREWTPMVVNEPIDQGGYLMIPDSKHGIDFYTAIIQPKKAEKEVFYNDNTNPPLKTGKRPSSTFIHEILDEFLNGCVKNVINENSCSDEKAYFQNKSYENKGIPTRTDHAH